jgi:spore maturation protein CgeB
LKILVVASRHDYGDPTRGDSIDHYHLYRPLARLYPETHFFDFLTRLKLVGRRAMNDELVDLVRSLRPDVTIISLFGDEFEPAAVASLRTSTITVAYLYDDIWRRSFTANWAQRFDFVTTSDPGGVARIAAAGPGNAIYCPFSFDEEIFRRRPTPVAFDVSFVGLYHPYRAWVIGKLRRAGIKVSTFGYGWPEGRLDVSGMVTVFNASTVNLNISNSSHWDPQFLLAQPLALPRMLKHGKHREQVKVRHFEIAGCGGFQLSYSVDYLGEFFRPESEISTYSTVSELISKVRYFLQHDSERQAIADRAWERAQRDHTATIRYQALLREVMKRRTTPTPR